MVFSIVYSFSMAIVGIGLASNPMSILFSNQRSSENQPKHEAKVGATRSITTSILLEFGFLKIPRIHFFIVKNSQIRSDRSGA